MVFNATFSNISGISWRSVLLVEETRVPGENHRHFASRWQIKLYHFMLYRVHCRNRMVVGFTHTCAINVYHHWGRHGRMVVRFTHTCAISVYHHWQVADKLNFITLCCIGYTSPLAGFELTTLVVICTDCTGSCKSNYHTTMTGGFHRVL
jgi:hypothetical protein